ncbi:MAG: DUF3105 domain-containing protein [Paracoccaceae bacterium]
MAKSKTRKTKAKSGGKTLNYGASIGRPRPRANLIAAVVVAAVLLGGGAFWWTQKQAQDGAEQEVAGLALQGLSVLSQVRTIPVQGNSHLSAGQTRNYVEPFPTSGDHAVSPTRPGYYQREMPSINLVHSLEHGSIVIYYDAPGDAAIERIKEWTSLFQGSWDGVVAAQSPGLGEVVVMTAWTKLLRLETFDDASAAAFLDLYRGRGPENAVR